jgi:hypothetical protein
VDFVEKIGISPIDKNFHALRGDSLKANLGHTDSGNNHSLS